MSYHYKAFIHNFHVDILGSVNLSRLRWTSVVSWWNAKNASPLWKKTNQAEPHRPLLFLLLSDTIHSTRPKIIPMTSPHKMHLRSSKYCTTIQSAYLSADFIFSTPSIHPFGENFFPNYVILCHVIHIVSRVP